MMANVGFVSIMQDISDYSKSMLFNFVMLENSEKKWSNSISNDLISTKE
jgi:hypothetical protein